MLKEDTLPTQSKSSLNSNDHQNEILFNKLDPFLLWVLKYRSVVKRKNATKKIWLQIKEANSNMSKNKESNE